MRSPRWSRAPLAALLWILAGCSDDSVAPTQDSGPTGDAAALYPCKEPGLTCNPHDPCAINPVCGKDLLCHPESYQNCDDGLDCTVDTCGQSGSCLNTPKEGSCALLVKDPKGGASEMKCLASGAVIAATSPRWGGATPRTTNPTPPPSASWPPARGTRP